MNLKNLLLSLACCLPVAGITPSAAAAVISNGSFETGDFTGWIATDIADPYLGLSVVGAGFNDGLVSLTTHPTDGAFVALIGVDGGGPGVITLAQDVGIIDAASSTFTFDYHGAWDTASYGPAAVDRVFSVIFSPAGGGAPLGSVEIFRATANTILDTGSRSASLDLSAYIGTDLRITFNSDIPESFTGPGFMQIDKVSLGLSAVPEPTNVLFTGLLLGSASLLRFRTRRPLSA